MTAINSSSIEHPSIKKKRVSGVFLKGFIKWTWTSMVLMSILQCMFFWSIENLFAIGCSLLSWSLTTKFILKKFYLKRFTLSSLVILGYAITQYYLPLIFTLLEGKPMVYNLKYTYEVFLHSLLGLIILIVVHHLYIRFSLSNNGLRVSLQSILRKSGLFTTPLATQVWLIGFIGLLSMFFVYFIIGNRSSEGNGGNKLIEGLMPFSYAPYFILIRKMYADSFRLNKSLIIKILLYTLILFLLSIGRNSRGAFMVGFTALGIGYFLGLLLDKFSPKIFNFKNFFLIAFALWLITGPLSDLGIAMVIVRSQRSQISREELITRTLNVYQDKDALRFYKMISLSKSVSDWDEKYFDNIFLSRFCNLKYNDSNLGQANKLSGIDPMMQQYSIDRFWATFPQPILSVFQINIDKKTVSSSSFGDYLFFCASGGGLGGFRTGQFAGTGMASFGWWYLLLLGVGIFPVFYLLDLLIFFYKDSKTDTYETFISLAGLLSFKVIFMFLSQGAASESVINIFAYVIRGWIQLIFLYWLIFKITYFFSKLIKR